MRQIPPISMFRPDLFIPGRGFCSRPARDFATVKKRIAPQLSDTSFETPAKSLEEFIPSLIRLLPNSLNLLTLRNTYFFMFTHRPPSSLAAVGQWEQFSVLLRIETPEALAERLQRAVTHVNKSFNVRGLCMELPARLRALVETSHGDRLPK